MTGANDRRSRPKLLRVIIPLLAVVALLGAVPTASAHHRGTSWWDVWKANVKFFRLDVARDAGYGEFYICTDHETPGVGAMGQHFANGPLVEDPAVDPLHPEVLIYEPLPNGRLRLVGVEYVVIQDAWHDKYGPGTPRVLGREMETVAAGNRYGLPAFYELHVWLYKYNPSGFFADWNPRVSCHGNGDPA